MPFFYLQYHPRGSLNDFVLSQSPNGTPLSIAQNIHTKRIDSLEEKRVYWITEEKATPEWIASVKALNDVSIVKLPTNVTIYDETWSWNDKDIDAILLPLINAIDCGNVIGPLDHPCGTSSKCSNRICNNQNLIDT